MKRLRWILPLILLTLVVACGATVWLVRTGIGPRPQRDLTLPRIYAYRDWQSVGMQLEPGDMVHIRAQGRWLYTPGEYHGPEGHASYPAPDTYPIPGQNVAGGVLLARIGENGRPMLVGRGRTIVADQAGLLYFRINDDVLSDNEGYVAVEVSVEPYSEAEP
ncbi:MAG: hypothetical protein JXC32_11010 [Anaerolineae bacterium]|nr:hypothetical protein [Anaerolineae bacterium]